MNNTEIIATDAGVADFARSSAPLSSYTAPNVDATIEAKAATTRISVRYEKIMNSCFARLLMLVEMISPIDWPLLRTDAKSAPKSCTPPKKIPPMRIQRVTGSQPKIAAPIGPVIGPAPAIDENDVPSEPVLLPEHSPHRLPLYEPVSQFCSHQRPTACKAIRRRRCSRLQEWQHR